MRSNGRELTLSTNTCAKAFGVENSDCRSSRSSLHVG